MRYTFVLRYQISLTLLKMKLSAATIVDMLVKLLTVFSLSNIKKKMLDGEGIVSTGGLSDKADSGALTRG